MIKVIVNDKEYTKESPLNLEEFADELGILAYCVKVNNRLRELNYNLTFDAKLEYLDLKDA